ncbi:hypothetical protein X798_02283, partial [Onchocerca flexuosa]
MKITIRSAATNTGDCSELMIRSYKHNRSLSLSLRSSGSILSAGYVVALVAISDSDTEDKSS